METYDSLKEAITQLSALQAGVIVVVFIFLLVGLRLVLKKPPAHLTAFSGEAGSVLVSRKALQELVRAACLLDDWVEAARPVIRVKNNKVTARVELRLSKPDDLKSVCERVQNHISALLQKSLNFDQIGEIQIVVKSFSNESGKQIDPVSPTAESHLPTPAPTTSSQLKAEPKKSSGNAPQKDDHA